MTAFICATCGVQFEEADVPPESCPICLDERQYVGWDGQIWTSRDELAASHHTEVREEEPGLVGIGMTPSFAIGQRALVVTTPAGNLMWDCISLLDDEAAEAIEALGGLAAICCSHPHFYGSCVDFADRFNAPIYLPEADRRFVMRPSGRIEYFADRVEPVPGLTCARIGGHFDGASVLHWPAGAGGKGALLTGDTVQVVPDRRYVSFMWSYPNLIPLGEKAVLEVAERVGAFEFDRIYGGWWGRAVLEDGAAAVRRSAERYVERLRGGRPASS